MTTFRRTRRTTKLPLPEVIADAVAEAIAMNRLQPGDRVVETALADELGASRVPTREALKVLHTQGILSGGRRGYRVSVFDAAVVSQILELRLMLESILLRDAVANWRRGQARTDELHAIIGKMEAAARRGDTKASLRGDLDFHRAIGRASGNSIAATLWEAIARHVLIIFSRPEYRDEDIGAVPQQHRDLLRFIEDQITDPGSDEEIRRGLEEHLLLVLRRRPVGLESRRPQGEYARGIPCAAPPGDRITVPAHRLTAKDASQPDTCRSMRALLRRLPDEAALLLVGDVDQFPSGVGLE